MPLKNDEVFRRRRHQKPNMEQALREHMGKYVPSENRNFFSIGLRDPPLLYSYFYHWFDLGRYDNPHASIRRLAFYNIYDSKAKVLQPLLKRCSYAGCATTIQDPEQMDNARPRAAASRVSLRACQYDDGRSSQVRKMDAEIGWNANGTACFEQHLYLNSRVWDVLYHR